MENLTPTSMGVVVAAIIGMVEISKLGLRMAARKMNGRVGGEGPKHVYKSDLVALRHEIGRDMDDSVSTLKDYMQENFRDFGERLARIEQRADDGEKR